MILNVLVTDHVGSFWYKQPKLILCLLIFKWCLEITIAEEKDFPVKMAELVNLMDHAHVHYLTVDLIVLLTQVNHVIIKWKTKLSPCLKSSEIQNKNITLSEKFRNPKQKYHPIWKVPKSNRKIVSRGKFDTPCTHTWPLIFLVWNTHFNKKRRGKTSE